jgi:hypothetical protein
MRPEATSHAHHFPIISFLSFRERFPQFNFGSRSSAPSINRWRHLSAESSLKRLELDSGRTGSIKRLEAKAEKRVDDEAKSERAREEEGGGADSVDSHKCIVQNNLS